MKVDDPDLAAFESATRAQLRARELGKVATFIPNLRPNAPVPKSMGKSSHYNAPRGSQCGTSSHKQSNSDESPEDLEKSTEWIFQGYLFFGSDGWRTDETYEAEVRAVVEKQYLPKVPVPDSRSSTWHNFLSFSGRTRHRYFEIGDSRLCTGAFHKPTTVEIHWRNG